MMLIDSEFSSKETETVHVGERKKIENFWSLKMVQVMFTAT